ncbi:MAG TPA: DinB family protein [Gemmatimonadaceae bacterium]|nr:DinB family protein [Gemmatimonadaceae bacterium]
MTDVAGNRAPAAALPEVWLRGPLDGFDPIVMPAAHALLQSAEDLERAASLLTRDELWARPGGAASVGFHLQHVAGTIDRLLTYARGEQLDAAQLAALKAEKDPGAHASDADALIAGAVRAIQRAVETLRDTPRDSLFEKRFVGRKQLPTTVWGLLFHIAEHTQRHTGQVITTSKIVRGE